MSTRFSEQQLDVIDARVQNMLVSAAAGSGKTTVLVERIIRRIINGTLDIDEVLVVTFTNAAADNMRKKIEKAIRSKLSSEEVKNNPELSDRLRRQLRKLPNAYIQTLNSFCTRVIKEKGYEIATSNETDTYYERMLEPNVPVIADSELKLLRTKAAEEAISAEYSRIGSDNTTDDVMDDPFIMLADFFGDGRSDNSLVSSLCDTFVKLRSIPNYIDVIDAAFASRVKCDNDGIVIGIKRILDEMSTMIIKASEGAAIARNALDTIEPQFVKDNKKNIARIEEFHTLIDITSSVIDGFKSGYESLDSDKERYELIKSTLLDLNGNEEWNCPGFGTKSLGEDVLEFCRAFTGLAGLVSFVCKYKKSNNIAIKTPTNLKYKDVYGVSDDYVSLFAKTVEYDDFLVDQKIRTKVIGSYIDLLKATNENYAKLKSFVHGMDFGDQEHYAMRVLQNESAMLYYRDKFNEIYIDEYQDNSSLQDAIIATFANGNVFMVGDVKQSIYKFRNANPNLFINKMAAYKGEDGGKLYLLSNNYRSSNDILQFVNGLEEQLMNEASEIDYSDGHALNCGNTEIVSEHGIEVIAIDTEDANENDIRALCNGEILDDEVEDDEEVSESDNETSYNDADSNKDRLLQASAILSQVNKYVTGEGVSRKYEYGEIAILVSKRSTARKIMRMLNRNGYPANCPEETNIFHDQDINVLCSLITVIGNQHRDNHLLGVMIAPYAFSNFTIDEIARITLEADKVKEVGRLNLITRLRVFASEDSNIASISEEMCSLVDKVRNFLKVIDDIRASSVYMGIGELVDKIFMVTGIRATVRLNGGSSAVLKLDVWRNWLCTNFAARGSDIVDISNSLEQMNLKLAGDASIEFEESRENKISVMTSHKSKGLEFPCVIVAELSSKGNNTDSKTINFEEGDGFIAKMIDRNTRKEKLSIEYLYLSNKLKLAENSEKIRLIYVALTRAINELSVIVSYNPKSDGMKYLNMDVVGFPIYSEKFFVNRSGAQDLFLAGCMRIRECVSVLSPDTMVQLDSNSIVSCNNVHAHLLSWQEVCEKEAKLPKHAGAGASSKEISVKPMFKNNNGSLEMEEYGFVDSISIPAKTSVSILEKESEQAGSEGIKFESGVSNNINSISLAVPRYDMFFEKNKLSASSLGTLFHNVMRLIDLKKISEVATLSGKDIAACEVIQELDGLVERGLIIGQERIALNPFVESIVGFAMSTLCEQLVEADNNDLAFYEKEFICEVDVGINGDTTLVQGIIDVMYIKDGKATIIDYKTDRVDNLTVDAINELMLERHGAQIELYRSAVEASGIEVENAYLWVVRAGVAVEVK